MVARLNLREAQALGLVQPSDARAARLRRRGIRAAGPDAPQARLRRIVCSAVADAVVEFYPIPGRRYRADVAIPKARLIVECDGWEHHGKFKADFMRDRKRDRDLLLAGWKVLRFTAGEIRRSPRMVIEAVRAAIAVSDNHKNRGR